MKVFFFFGDSITLGVNDVMAGGWVGRFAGLVAQAGVPVPPTTFYNLGVRRHASTQIRNRWKTEFYVRKIADADPFLIFCFGTVDMAAPTGSVVVPVPDSVENARHILKTASETAPVLLVSPPPVRQADHNERIAALNTAYAELCQSLAVPYLDIYSELARSPIYKNDLSDGLHPGEAGNRLIAEKLASFAPVREWLEKNEPSR